MSIKLAINLLRGLDPVAADAAEAEVLNLKRESMYKAMVDAYQTKDQYQNAINGRNYDSILIEDKEWAYKKQ